SKNKISMQNAACKMQNERHDAGAGCVRRHRFAFFILHFAFCIQACAHQFSQGRVEVVIYPDKIVVWASVTVEEVAVQQNLPVNDDDMIVTTADAYKAHGKYLLKHIFLKADGTRLEGRV